MGWLFGAKKVPKVPLPQGYKLDEGALRFPTMNTPQQRVIQPEQVKQAVGFEKPFSFPEDKEEQSNDLPMPSFSEYSEQPKQMSVSNQNKTSVSFEEKSAPLYVKVEVYQQILGQLDGLKSDLNHLSDSNRQLESSEYNEQNNFDRLRRAVKSMHDRLLQIDKELFNSQGD
jgi:hypothetical protein